MAEGLPCWQLDDSCRWHDVIAARWVHFDGQGSSRLLAVRRRGLPQLILQPGVLPLQLLDPHLEVLHLFARTDAHFLDDLDEAPKTQDDDQRGNLLDDAAGEDVDEEAGDDDQGIEYVEPRSEITEFPSAEGSL